MKSATLFLVSVLIFVFPVPSLSTSIRAADDELVLDVQGNPLEKDAGYFLSLPGWGAASGRVWLTPPIQNNETCVADVVLRRPSLLPSDGTPFTFTLVNGNEEGIKLRSGLAIQSPSQNPCGGSTVWKTSYREGLLTPIITTGGIINTTISCFRIIKTQPPYMGNLYAFQHCLGTCGQTPKAERCWLVSTIESVGREHLSLNGSPLWFQFLKNSVSAAKQNVVSF